MRHRKSLASPVLLPLLLSIALLFSMLPVQSAEAAQNEDSDAFTQTLYLPSVSRRTPPCFTQVEPSIYGIQMYGNTGKTAPYYQSMMNTKVDWIRVPIRWSSVEPEDKTPAKYKWATADAAVKAALDGCKTVIITHQTAPAWAAEYPESVINSDTLDDFEEYLSALVERYNGDGYRDAAGSPVILYWELYNEPDASNTILNYEGWGEHPEEYVEMLKTAHKAIKDANPQAQVLMGGIAHDWFLPNGPFVRSFVDKVLAADAGKYFDIFNIHAYPGFGETWVQEMNHNCQKTDSCRGPGLFEKVQYMQQKLDDNGLGNKPIIITESGWYSERDPEKPSTPEVQARYVTELSVQSKAAGVEAMIQFSLVDPQNVSHDYGIITTTGAHKPAYTAFQVVIAKLAQAKYLRRLTVGETGDKDMDAYKFQDPTSGQIFYVAWLNPAEMGIDLDGDGIVEEKEDKENLHLPGNEAKVYDIYDKLVQTVVGNGGDLKIPIGGQPRYIVITN